MARHLSALVRAGLTPAGVAPLPAHLALGARGERIAADVLERAGYRLVAANFKLPVGRNLRGAVVQSAPYRYDVVSVVLPPAASEDEAVEPGARGPCLRPRVELLRNFWTDGKFRKRRWAGEGEG
ncbi:MAG: hypothetical protein LC800_20665 [Acidobacteria bacterium]|nr:hypothetical protein [Acidobacteriota bacterium]